MKQIFIQRLNEKMKEQGLTKRDLAEKTGLSVRSIEYFQNGKRFPNVESLLKISMAFNVSMEYMIGEAGLIKPMEFNCEPLKQSYQVDYVEPKYNLAVVIKEEVLSKCTQRDREMIALGAAAFRDYLSGGWVFEKIE